MYTVAIDVLRDGVYNNIGTMFQRILDIWRQEGIIHDDQHAKLMRGLRHGSNIHQRQCRVGWRLDPNELCRWLDKVSNIQLN